MLVGAEGFEPPTLCSQSRCATRLRYAPTCCFDCSANRIRHAHVGESLEPAGQPGDEPDSQHDRDGKYQSERGGQSDQEGAVPSGVPARLLEVAAEEQIVAPVGLPGDVKDVAEDGHRSHQNADAEIGSHAHQGHVGHAANPCGQRNEQREQAGQHVAQAGNQAEDAVEAEANGRAGDAEGFVEQNLQRVERAVAEQPGAAIPAIRRGVAVGRPGRPRRVGLDWSLTANGELSLRPQQG